MKIEWDLEVSGKTRCEKSFYKALFIRYLIGIFILLSIIIFLSIYLNKNLNDNSSEGLWIMIIIMFLFYLVCLFLMLVVCAVLTAKNSKLDLWLGVSPNGVIVYSAKKKRVIKTIPFGKLKYYLFKETKNGNYNVYLCFRKPRKLKNKNTSCCVANCQLLEAELSKYLIDLRSVTK